jgi:uracil-DNA glycosylase
LDAEWRLTGGDVRFIVALGAFAWRAALQMIRNTGGTIGAPAPQFGHGATADLDSPHGKVTLIGCYHPSQQNTFTGKLTPQMLDDIFRRAASEIR